MKEYIKILGVNHPVNFGTWCIRQWRKETGLNIEEIDLGLLDKNGQRQELDEDEKDNRYISLFIQGLKDGARIDKIEPPDLDVPSFLDLSDALRIESTAKGKPRNLIVEMVEIFTRSWAVPEKGEDKKKAAPTTNKG